jgi:exopolysaccharide production protein ExoQ
MTAQPTDRLAWTATMVCMLGLVVTLAGSSLGALLFLVAWGLVIIPRADRCLGLMFRSPGLWLIPCFALLSIVWSQAREATLRATVEFALTVGVASLTAGFLRPREFLSAMSVSLLVGAVLSLAFGRYGFDGMTGETVFLGIFASKNTMALFMSFLAIVSAAVMADPGQPGLLRLLAVLSFLLSLPLLLLAHSAGALLTTSGSLIVLVLTVTFARLRVRERLLLLAGIATIILPIILIVVLLALNGTLGHEISDFIIQVLGKDPTLTGRTVLWRIALTEIAKRPLLGVGYYAFWQQGNLMAEAIWREFSIDSRMGFSFHDTYLEFAVELGWVGVAALVVTFIQVVERSVRMALADQTWATACLVAVLFCLMTRTFDEVDLPYPFAAPTFLFFVVAAYGADYARLVRRDTRVVAARAGWDLAPTEQPQPRGLTT